MTDKALTTTTDQDHTPAEYGDRQEVAVLGKRIKAMLPGADKMDDTEAMALAQYAMLLDANPFRGEVYGYKDSHGFHLVDGYKMLVRWARKQCPYTETYERLTDLPSGAIGYRCFILRDDARATLREFVQLGAEFKQAYELATVSAVGVVTKSDMTRRSGGESPPPSGWTWDQVARKRALKNTLNLSHGAPSPRDIAAQSWIANGKETTAADWETVTPEMPAYEREAVAAGKAKQRVAHNHAQELMDGGMTGQDAIDELFEDYVDADAEPVDVVEEALEEKAGRVGKDPAELIALAPPTSWNEFWTRTLTDLKFTHGNHATNAYRQIFPHATKENPPAISDAWAQMIDHQREAGRLEAGPTEAQWLADPSADKSHPDYRD